MKIKVINDFIANKKTINAKTFKKDENNVQSILYRRVVNKSFEIIIKINKTKVL